MDRRNSQRRKQVEEGMWAVLRRHLLVRRAANVAAAGSCGLWKAPHVSQCCHWDCGVACAQMVLRGLGREAERSSLLASLGTRSVWTIDLAMLLHRQGVRFMYCTRTAGVNESYSTVDFYRTNFPRDTARVQSLFQAAEEAKVGAVRRTFSWQELAVLVSGYDYAAIVLVDSRHLYPTAYRMSAPMLAPPSPTAAVAASPACSPGPAATNSGVSPAGSTPKRHREDRERGVFRFGGEGTEGEEEVGTPSRRRRRTPRAVQVGFDRGGEEEVAKAWVGRSPHPAAQIAPDAVAPLPMPLSGREDEQDSNSRGATQHLRVSPAPHAVEESSSALFPFVTPLPPQSGRKMLTSNPSGALGDGFAAERRRERHDVQDRTGNVPRFSPAPSPVSPSSSSSFGTPAVSCGASSAPPVLASPPPLKSSSLVAPVSTPGSTGSPRPGLDASPSKDSSYCGHYILLVGWSETDGVFLARDPALPSATSSSSASSSSPSSGALSGGRGDPDAHVCIALTPEALDMARHSYGTDEDVLIIDLARSRKGGVSTAPLAAAAAATALAASAASSATAASAMVGLFAMAAAAAAAGADVSGFKEWGWPDPAAWFGGNVGSGGGSDSVGGGTLGDGEQARRAGGGLGEGLPQGGAESAARRLAGLLSLASSGWRLPTVGDAYQAYRSPRVPWRSGGVNGGGSGEGNMAAEEDEGERWAARMASAMEGLLQGGRRAAYSMEGLLQGGRRAAYSMEGLFQGGAHTMEGLLQGGRRAAYTMEGLLEGGRRAAYSLRDSLADVADAPGGAGAECCAGTACNPPGSPMPSSLGTLVSSA